MLRGRVRERAAIDGLLERARSGRGGGLVLHGEPGIGKTALLEYAAGEAAGSGLRVLRTAGVEPESDLGYAALHRLLFPVLDRIEQLPEPQRAGLGVVFGQTTGPAPDRFLVALAALSLLSEVAGEQPVLCVVDDAHWTDAPSLDALAFVARRLDAEPIAVALAARADEGSRLDVSGLVEVPLAGLDRDAASGLLAERRAEPPTGQELDDVLRATGGNPLALRELPAGRVTAGEPVPLATGLRNAFLERVRQRDPDAQRLLLLVAADGSGRTDTIRRAAAVLGTDPEPLLGGALDDLVTEDGGTLAFRHPLIRSATYHAADRGERRAAHRALATALDDVPAELDRRAWHLGQAADGPDGAAADELERSAEQALRRAGPAAAAAALVRAAELSPNGAERARRSVAAANAWWQGGYADRATAQLERAEQTPDLLTDTVRLDLAATRALIELRAGSPSDAVARLLPVVPDALRTDRHRAIELLMLIGEAGYTANVADAWTETVERVERLDLDGDGSEDVLTRLFRAACRARAGAELGLAAGDLDAVERLTDPARLAWSGGMAWGIGDRGLARRLHRKAEALARASGAVGVLAWVLDYLVVDELQRGRFARAEGYAEEGHRFAVESGQPNSACRHRASLALLAAYGGRADEVGRLAADVLVEANERRLAGPAATAHRALGLVELAAGRPGEALDRFEQLVRDGRDAHPGILLTVGPDLVEAAVRAEHRERATEPMERFDTWAAGAGAPDLRALAARCRALLASGSEADIEFQHALEAHAMAEQPMEYARTELLYGEFLRRERRRTDARPHLRAALETFRGLGAPVWADRARDELRASGETARHGEPTSQAALTPQERRIATAVGGGATNREIAAALFLSPRTVDYHLRKVFQKLGISSRTELIRLQRDSG